MRKIITAVIDDLDGTEGAHERTFSLDGSDYTIDLTDANYAKLCTALADFIDASQVIGGASRRNRVVKQHNDQLPIKTIRAWWREQGQVAGIPFGGFGRIPHQVIAAWQARTP